MTQEEFKNLKVGDVVTCNHNNGNWYTFKLIDNRVGTVIETNYDFWKCGDHCSLMSDHESYELLPLYNSPLYLAMSESDDSNEIQETEEEE